MPLGAEPSHRQVLATADVRVFRVEVAPHATTKLHEHANDFLWIALGDAEIVDHASDGSESHIEAQDGVMRFRSRSVVHKVSNERDAPFRNMTIEFLHPQTGQRNQCAQVVKEQAPDCPSSAADTGKRHKGPSILPMFQTDQTQVGLLSLDPGAKFTVKASKSPPVLIALEGTDAEALVELKIPGAVGKGKRPLRTGDAMEVPSGIAVELRNNGAAPARFVYLEFRGR